MTKDEDTNGRRLDIAEALIQEDEREGQQRDIRSRVDSAIEFERDFPSED